ncbi:YciI family protein [Brevibacillus halotolerans]|uniref:YciI family protein n=1 Tax=Brevibacillus halotolerans TaxID=1507437 RepID=UPI0015EF3A24|nr:YciI family protein [Brevibacillus halotolerans]MBA4535532.1 hypothetical protein [Brevibacillus halotolerans]
MKDLFLELLQKQPSGQVYFGVFVRDKADKRDKSDKRDKRDKSGGKKKLELRPSEEYKISPENRFFAAIFSEKNDAEENNQNLIDQHLAHLRSLWDEGRLVFAGSFNTGDRGLLVISAESIEEAGEIVKNDPIFQNACYGKVDIEEVAGFEEVKTFES